jgi:hypothetical protein
MESLHDSAVRAGQLLDQLRQEMTPQDQHRYNVTLTHSRVLIEDVVHRTWELINRADEKQIVVLRDFQRWLNDFWMEFAKFDVLHDMLEDESKRIETIIQAFLYHNMHDLQYVFADIIHQYKVYAGLSGSDTRGPKGEKCRRNIHELWAELKRASKEEYGFSLKVPYILVDK